MFFKYLNLNWGTRLVTTAVKLVSISSLNSFYNSFLMIVFYYLSGELTLFSFFSAEDLSNMVFCEFIKFLNFN